MLGNEPEILDFKFEDDTNVSLYLLTYFLDRSRESTVALQTMRSFIIAASSPVLVAPVSLFSWST